MGMAEVNGGVRERKGIKPNGSTKTNGMRSADKKGASAERGNGLSIMDVLRIVGGLFLLNCLLSYFITNDSVLWGWRPWFVRPRLLARWMVREIRHV